MKLELGAGRRTPVDAIGVDVNPRDADVVADALHLPFADRSVDAIRAIDVLEHLSWRHTIDALHEWWRVLRPDGELFVQVPDAGLLMRWYAEHHPALHGYDTDRRPCPPIIGLAWRLLGGHDDGIYVGDGDDWRWNAHYAIFDREHLESCLRAVGFAVIRVETNAHPNLLTWATRGER